VLYYSSPGCAVGTAVRHARVKLNHIGKGKLKEIDFKGTVSHDFEPLDFKINS
jgi:hypothetical protein